jgi:ATP-dependent RNA helicase DeaD
MAWFRMSVGRRNNADPRWLVPIICRLGHVTKKEIGSIRIFDRETKFEIAEAVAGRFAAAVRRATPNDEDIRIEPAGMPDRGGKAGGKPLHRRSPPQGHDGGKKRSSALPGPGMPGPRSRRTAGRRAGARAMARASAKTRDEADRVATSAVTAPRRASAGRERSATEGAASTGRPMETDGRASSGKP